MNFKVYLIILTFEHNQNKFGQTSFNTESALYIYSYIFNKLTNLSIKILESDYQKFNHNL